MDTLNFSFWSEEPSARCKVEFKGKKYTGYFSLLAAMNKALEVCSPILYNWYFLKAFNFHYFRPPHGSAKITSSNKDPIKYMV